MRLLEIDSSELAKSFWTLAKYNDGRFKSERQAAFLRSMAAGQADRAAAHGIDLDRNAFNVQGPYGSKYYWVFHLDDQGITWIEKTRSEGVKTSTEVQWSRQGFQPPIAVKEPRRERKELSDEEYAINRLKRAEAAVRKIKRDIAATETSTVRVPLGRIPALKTQLNAAEKEVIKAQAEVDLYKNDQD